MIKIDIEMPTSCDKCILAKKITSQYFGCPVLDKAIPTGHKSDNCPLHPLDDEIRVGDEVRLSERLGVVMNIGTNYTGTTFYDVFRYDGGFTIWEARQCTKTGRHFDEVETLLKNMMKKMRGDNND